MRKLTSISEVESSQASHAARKKEYARRYYEKHKVDICKKVLNERASNSIETIQAKYPEAVERYLQLYPFDQYGERNIQNILYRNGLRPSQAAYADCYGNGMLAYLYSIHRCAAMGCHYVVPYIKKMIRIYMLCTLVVYNDSGNLCRANGFREVRLDGDETGRLY